jgi:hypothetical protein
VFGLSIRLVEGFKPSTRMTREGPGGGDCRTSNSNGMGGGMEEGKGVEVGQIRFGDESVAKWGQMVGTI